MDIVLYYQTLEMAIANVMKLSLMEYCKEYGVGKEIVISQVNTMEFINDFSTTLITSNNDQPSR